MTIALTSVIAALVGSVLAYVGAARRLSGKIATSEAESLWKESASIRDDYRGRLAHAEERLAEVEKRLASTERENNELIRQNQQLALRHERCEEQTDELKERVDSLVGDNELLRDTIKAIGEELHGHAPGQG